MSTEPKDEQLIDILEPHYWNQGFEYGKEAKSAAKNSQTYKQIEALITKRETLARIEEIKFSKKSASDNITFSGWEEDMNMRLAELNKGLDTNHE